MNNEDIVTLDSRIIKDKVDFIIKDTNDTIIQVNAIYLNNGNIEYVIDNEGNTHTNENIVLVKNLLFIPGIGYIPEETRIIYKEVDYILLYGWHTNISNQNILSWYLMPLSSNIPYKTLYKDMIDDIEVVHFR